MGLVLRPTDPSSFSAPENFVGGNRELKGVKDAFRELLTANT